MKSGSKAKDGKERERDWAKRLNDGNNNGKLRIANATSGGARKAAWAKSNKIIARCNTLGTQGCPFIFPYGGGLVDGVDWRVIRDKSGR